MHNAATFRWKQPFYAISLVFITAIAIIYLYPLVWLADSSFRPAIEIFQVPPVFLQEPAWEAFSSWSLTSFVTAFTKWKIGTAFLMSTLVTSVGILLTLGVCSLSAYGFAFLEFRFKKLLFTCVLASMMLPMTTMIAPYYKVLNRLGLTNNLLGLIIPYAVSAFGVFLLRQYYIKIPRALIESARIDGAGHLKIWWSIILPLSKPALSALAIIQFRQIWNDFMMPLIVLRSEELFTLPVKIQVMDSVNIAKPYDVIIASGFITALIPMIMFIMFQRYFIEGLTGGVKQ